MNILEKLHTRFFYIYVIALSTMTLALMYLSVQFDWITQEQLSKGVDITLKTLAFFAGSAWALNRYYVARTDIPHIRIDPIIDVVSPSKLNASHKLLIFRLDVVNTGKVRLDELTVSVHVDSVSLRGTKVEHERVRQSAENPHPAVIEPGSWSAINAEVVLPEASLAVRLLVVLTLRGKTWTTWHRTFAVRSPAANGGTSSPVLSTASGAPLATEAGARDSRSESPPPLEAARTIALPIQSGFCGELLVKDGKELVGREDQRGTVVDEGPRNNAAVLRPDHVRGIVAEKSSTAVSPTEAGLLPPSQELTMSTTGEKPGKGTYRCTKCGQTVRLDDDSDRLPPCPSCQGTEYRP